MDVRLGRRCLAPQVAVGETRRARPINLGGWLELAAVQSHNTVELLHLTRSEKCNHKQE